MREVAPDARTRPGMHPALVLALAVMPVVALLLNAGCRGPESHATDSAVTRSRESVARAPFGLDPALLPFTVDAGDMHIVGNGTIERIGSSTSTVERAVVGSRPVIRLILRQDFSLSSMTDTLDVDPVTLLPIRYRNSMGEIQSAAVDYGAQGRVSARSTRMGESSSKDTTLTVPFLDGALFQPLISALPLAAGYAARIPVFHFQAGAREVGVRVVSAGAAPYAGGERPVWFVEYEGAPGRVILLAIDREDRRMLRAESQIDADRRYVQVTK